MSLLPTDWKIITVDGVSTNTSGTANVGAFVFAPSQSLIVSGVEVAQSQITAPIDPTTGAFSADLPASNDPAVSPQGTYYTVYEKFPEGRAPYAIFVDYATPGGTANLFDIAPVVPPPQLVSTQGPAGPANVLTIGTVTTLSPGTPASASINGTSPDQTLNLGIPTGETGTTDYNALTNKPTLGTVASHDVGEFATAAQGTLATNAVPQSQLATANGVATLGSDAKLLTSQIPTSLLGQVSYQGTWNASLGTPPSTTPTKGQYWIVSVAGSTNLSGITSWNVGDWAIYDIAWDKVDNTDAVSSVAGLTGIISTASLQTALSLGSAAYTPSTAYATSAQGTLAGTALQPDAAGQLANTARRRKVVALGNIAGSVNFDLSSGGIITATLTGNVTGTWINLPPAGYIADSELHLSQDGTGGRTISFGGTGKWVGSTPFVLTPTPYVQDAIAYEVDSAGNWTGFPAEAIG